MKARVGLHFFGRNHSIWAVWCYDKVNEVTGFTSAQKVATCYSYEDAVRKMYELNNWGEPKYIQRKF